MDPKSNNIETSAPKNIETLPVKETVDLSPKNEIKENFEDLKIDQGIQPTNEYFENEHEDFSSLLNKSEGTTIKDTTQEEVKEDFSDLLSSKKEITYETFEVNIKKEDDVVIREEITTITTIEINEPKDKVDEKQENKNPEDDKEKIESNKEENLQLTSKLEEENIDGSSVKERVKEAENVASQLEEGAIDSKEAKEELEKVEDSSIKEEVDEKVEEVQQVENVTSELEKGAIDSKEAKEELEKVEDSSIKEEVDEKVEEVQQVENVTSELEKGAIDSKEAKEELEKVEDSSIKEEVDEKVEEVQQVENVTSQLEKGIIDSKEAKGELEKIEDSSIKEEVDEKVEEVQQVENVTSELEKGAIDSKEAKGELEKVEDSSIKEEVEEKVEEVQEEEIKVNQFEEKTEKALKEVEAGTKEVDDIKNELQEARKEVQDVESEQATSKLEEVEEKIETSGEVDELKEEVEDKRVQTHLESEYVTYQENRQLQTEIKAKQAALEQQLLENQAICEELSNHLEKEGLSDLEREEIKESFMELSASTLELKEEMERHNETQEMLRTKAFEMQQISRYEVKEVDLRVENVVDEFEKTTDYKEALEGKNSEAYLEASKETVESLLEEEALVMSASEIKYYEIYDYVTSHNMGRFQTDRDAHYQQMLSEYKELLAKQEDIHTKLITIDAKAINVAYENNLTYSSNTKNSANAHAYKTSVYEIQEKNPHLLEEVKNGTDQPLETDYFVEKETATKILKEFSQEAWEEMEIDEKKEHIEKLFEYNRQILNLGDDVKIDYYRKNDPNDYGMYVHSKKTLYINELNLGDGPEAADTVSHESRHAYQHLRAELMENERDIDWAINFDFYRNYPQYTIQEYLSQPVEKDAREYALNFKDYIDDIESGVKK